MKQEILILAFKSAKEWEKWLAKNHAMSDGIWLQLYKKNSGVQTVTYAEALDVALCYGWIDGLMNRIDDLSYKQKFTPRRAKSIWSKINIGNVERLIKEGRMKPAGLAQIEAAKADGRWEKAYDSSSSIAVPDDLKAWLSKNKRVAAFFESLTKANKYAILWRLQTAKRPETRARRFDQIKEMLKNGETFH